MSLGFSKINKETKSGFYFDIRQKDGKTLAIVAEHINGQRQPARIGYLDVVGSADNKFMTVRAPLREKNEDGSYKMQPRQRDGQFLDDKGKPVETEAQAAQEFVYLKHRGDENKLVYGQIATINVKNTKADNTPTQFTMLSVKTYTDDEALEAARLLAKMSAVSDKVGKDSDEYAQVAQEHKEVNRKNGTYDNFFIQSGHEFLEELGFEVRKREVDNAPSP